MTVASTHRWAIDRWRALRSRCRLSYERLSRGGNPFLGQPGIARVDLDAEPATIEPLGHQPDGSGTEERIEYQARLTGRLAVTRRVQRPASTDDVVGAVGASSPPGM